MRTAGEEGDGPMPAARAPALVDASFMGKFANKLAMYDALPALDEDVCCDITDDAAAESSKFTDASIMQSAIEEWPRSNLAALAERTRSQLLAMRPAASARGSEPSKAPAAPNGSAALIAVGAIPTPESKASAPAPA